MAGLTLVVDGINVGATTPGAQGSALSGTEVAFLDGVTAGTATASKAVVLNSSKGIATITSATITTMTGNVVGNVTGDVTGGVTGNVTGNLTGNVTGNVTGNITGNVTGNVTGSIDASGGTLQVKNAVTNVHDTTPTQAEMVTALGAAARGKIGTIDDNDGNTVGYLCFSSDASWFFIAGTKGA